MAKTVTTRLDEHYVKRIDDLAAQSGVDRSALLRSLLLDGLKEKTVRDALAAYASGKKSLWEAAEDCDLSLWEIIQEVKARHIHAPYDLKDLEKDLKGLHE